MAKDTDNLKNFHMVMPREMHIFLKSTAAVQDETMGNVVMRCLDKFKKKVEDRLTSQKTNV